MQDYPASQPQADAGLLYVHVADHVGMGNPEIPADFKQTLRKAWPRTFLIGGSLDAEPGAAAVETGLIDLVGIGRAFLANPDLVTRL